MKIVVSQERLAKALNIVSRVTMGAKSVLSILNNVLLRVEDGKLSLTATNLELAIVCHLGVKMEKAGVITVPAKLLAEFVSNLPKGSEVKLVVKDGKLTTSTDKYKSVINGVVADEFPELPEIDEKKAVKLKMGADELKNTLASVMVATSNDTTRPALTGVYFNTYEKVLYIAATDGYRLAEKRFVSKVESDVFAIVPASSLSEVMRSMGDEAEEVEVLLDDTQVRFRLGETEITSKLIDGSFPDYRQLIPKKTETNMVLPQEECVRVTKLAALFAKESNGSITCEASVEKKAFVISSIASEFGENASEIDTEVDKDGKVALNSRFLLDAINTVDEGSLRLGFSGKLAPVVIRNEKSEDYVHIIMPLKN